MSTQGYKLTCSHGNLIENNNCWACSYNNNYKQCNHNILENKCNICKWNKSNISTNTSNICQHWIPVSKKCYICEREKKRLSHFQNETIKLNENNFFGEKSQFHNYINPNTTNKTYPKTENDNIHNARREISGRDFNNRTKDMNNNNINSFMRRSLETVGFIENNNKNIWQTSLINNSFPNIPISNVNENSHLGISTRGTRKLDSTDFNNNLHLRRSMLQPDFRQGNRFYEDKPFNTRRDSYRDVGNQNAKKFQDQTKQMYSEMNYTKAYDKAAGINRG